MLSSQNKTMELVISLKDLFQSIPDNKKRVYLLFIIKKHTKFLNRCGFLENDDQRVYEEIRKILIEKNEELPLVYIK